MVKNMRAINLVVPKDRAAGGLIAVGEWVDVLITSTIETPGAAPMTRTACVAPCVRVVAKRNTLWPIYAPLPDGKPVHFTLEVNPYRAALIDYVSTRGNLLLTPLPACDQRELEEKRQLLVQHEDDKEDGGPLLAGPPDENESETARITAIVKGELAVGEADMARLFNLSTAPPPGNNVAIERLSGIRILESAQFTPSGNRTYPTGSGKNGPGYVPDFRFSVPTDCPTCAASNKGKN
jgi:hypothetical protein